MARKVAAEAEQVVAGEPRLRALHQVFIRSGCCDSRGHVSYDVRRRRSACLSVGNRSEKRYEQACFTTLNAIGPLPIGVRRN